MAFWSTIRQSRIKPFNQFRFLRHHSLIHGPNAVFDTASRTIPSVLNHQGSFVRRSLVDFPTNVRFFAAPVQATPKKEEQTSGPRLNEQITANVVRLVTEEGHRVLSRYEALQLAKSQGLDLVEVQRNAKPPVCKLMDYHKEKYKKDLNEKDRIKSKSESSLRAGACKEVRFAGEIEQRDLKMKADMVRRLTERGYRVKCKAKGNKEESAEQLLSRFLPLIEDISVVESNTRVLEKNQAHIIVKHVKFCPKKGSGKKAPKIDESTSVSPQRPVYLDVIESGPETENADTDEDFANLNSDWTCEDENNDLGKVVNLGDAQNRVAKDSSCERLRTQYETVSPPASVLSEFVSPGPIDSLRRHVGSTASVKAEHGDENRHWKGPRNTSSHSMNDFKGPCAQNSMRSEASFQKPQFNMNATPGIRPNKTPISLSANLRKTPFTDLPEEDSLNPDLSISPPRGYGIFSASRTETAPGTQDQKDELNRYKRVNNSDSVRNSGFASVSPPRNFPTSNLSRGPGGDRNGQRR